MDIVGIQAYGSEIKRNIAKAEFLSSFRGIKLDHRIAEYDNPGSPLLGIVIVIIADI